MTPDLSTRHPQVRFADALAELRREVDTRQRTYPDWIQRGRITKPDADYQIAIFTAIAGDIERYARFVATRQLADRAHEFTWHQRRQALQREQELRARVYPEWIAKGRLEQAEADRRCQILAAIVDLFDDGFDWHARNGLRVLLSTTPTNAAEAEAQTEWWHHYTAVMQARGDMPADQKELAL